MTTHPDSVGENAANDDTSPASAEAPSSEATSPTIEELSQRIAELSARIGEHLELLARLGRKGQK